MRINYIKTFLLASCLVPFLSADAQDWSKMLEDPKVNFYDVQNAFNTEWGNDPYERGKGWKQYKRWEYFMEPRLYPHGERHKVTQAWDEYLEFKRTYPTIQAAGFRAGNWTEVGPDTWQTVSYNPGNGRVNVVVEDPNNANILYAGVPSGGCWKSTDGGQSWTVLTDDLPVLGVSAIIVDPNNSNIVYIGTGDGDGSDTYSIGVLKSTDGGTTWNTTGLNWTISNYRTTRRLIMHPTNSNILFLAANSGLYKTTDGGNNWTQVMTGSMRDVEFKPGDPSIVYASSNRVYKSTDGGDNFQEITTGLPNPNDVNRVSLAVTPANPDYVYYLAGDDGDASFYGLYRSTNSGTSFTLQSNSPNIFTYAQDGNGSGGQSWYDMALAASTTNANEIYVGGINVWKSTDGGANWTIKTHWYYPPNIGYVHADIHTLDYYGTTNLYCGSDGGLFKSTDGGDTWSDLSSGMSIMQFYRFGGTQQSANLLIGGAQDNGTNLWDNNIWTHVIGADGMEAAIDPTNPQIMYGCIQNGGLRRSSDGGQSFNNIEVTNDVGAWVTPFILDPFQSNTIYAGYQDVWKSTNGGNSWTQLSNFNSNTLRSMAISESNTDYIYVATLSEIRKTTDGGNNWTDITTGLPNNSITYIEVDNTDPNHIWVTLSGYSASNKIMESTDGGATWTNITGNLPNLPANTVIHQHGSNGGIYIGMDVGIYYKDNTLGNWVSFMDDLPNVIVNEFEIHYGSGKIRAATYGRGVWESDLATPFTQAPTANFGYEIQTLCAGDPIEFTDLSLYAAPGWTWSFPGGTPATSTDQNPSVSYATAGTYTATLVVNNANGADTITQTFTVEIAPNEVQLDIQLDNYPAETTWEVADSNGNILVTGGPYSGLTDQLVSETFCLPDGCFEFTIYDSYGDGICCSYGNGYYNLLNSSGTVLVSGGSFGASETSPFCYGSSIPLAIDNIQTGQASCGLNNGSLVLTVFGGDGSYMYSIDGGVTFQSSNVFSGISGGTYSIVVEDGTGNTATATETVPENAAPIAVASSNTTLAELPDNPTINFFSNGTSNAVQYLWDFGDGATSTLANPSHTYTQVGTYDVVLRARGGNCNDYDTITVQVDQNIAQIELEANPSVEVIPNPFNNVFNLQIDLPVSEDVEITIFDALGQRVFWQEVDACKAYNQNINFGNQPNGIYIITVVGQNTSVAKRFVKAE